MKRFTFLACASLLAAAMASPSLASDLPRPAYKAPVYVAPFSWSGFYVGLNAGYAWGTADVSNVFGTQGISTTGGLVGGTLGYNLQTGNWVWGIETDIDASGLKGSSAAGAACITGTCSVKNTWYGTTRGRIGYAFDRWLPFITGGAAYGDVKLTTPGLSNTDTQIGWTAGLGVEWAFLGNWSTKIEYLYSDLGNANCPASKCVVSTNTDLKTNLVRLGINYRF